MRLIILFAGAFSAFCVSAQTRKIIVDDPVLRTAETFEVLKADKHIKQGVYRQSSVFSHNLMVEGYYKNNLKDSLWTFYQFDKHVILTGLYHEGQKTGIWKAFTASGQLNVEYDFTNNKLLTFTPSRCDTGKYLVINGKDTTQSYLERPPIYLDGEGRLWVEMITGMMYPKAARESRIEGTVVVGFTIDEHGAISNYRLKQSLGYGCDEEGVKAVKRATGSWLPGMLNGRPVAVEYELPLKFSMSN